MHVLFVTRADADERPGGDSFQMRETAKALRALGVDVTERLGPQDRGEYAKYDVTHLFNLQTPDFTHGEAEKAKGAGAKIALSTIYWDFAAEVRLAESPRWKLIASVIGNKRTLGLVQKRVEAVTAGERAKQRQIIEWADVCLPNSKAEIEHLRRLTPNVGSPIVVPNGIDPVRFDPARDLGLPTWARELGIESKMYILIAARVEPHKNQVAFCQAMQGSKRSIVLTGQSMDPAYVEACKALGAHYIGPLGGDELVASYKHARVHALPSFRETPGLASLEAAAMGCAVVSTSAGCAREYLRGQAVYCDPGSRSSMRDAVDQAWAAGPAKDLSERIRFDYTWEAAARATLEGYRRIT